MSICVPKCETWRWFSKPSSLTAPGRGVLQSDTHIHQNCSLGASALVVKHSGTDRPPWFSNRSPRKTTAETCLYSSGFLNNIRQTSDKTSSLTKNWFLLLIKPMVDRVSCLEFWFLTSSFFLFLNFYFLPFLKLESRNKMKPWKIRIRKHAYIRHHIKYFMYILPPLIITIIL